MIANGSPSSTTMTTAIANGRVAGHNSKETFQLLADLSPSSDSGSDVTMPEFTLPKRRIKLKRKFRNGGIVDSSRSSAAAVRYQLIRNCSVAVVFKVFGVLVISVGIGITVWLAVTLHVRMDDLRRQYLSIEEGSKGTPVEFHGIHSKLKELQNNQSALRDDVFIVNRTLDAITKEISVLKVGVTDLKKSLAETPELETLPKDFKELQSRLVSMGSKITDFESNLALVQNQLTATDKVNQNVNGQLEALRQKLDSLALVQHTTTTDESQKVFAYVDTEVKKLDDIVVDVNASVWDKLQWAVDDLHEHHKMITGLQSTVQNVSRLMATMESNASDAVLSSNLTSLLKQPQFRELVEHVIEEMGSSMVRNGSMTSLVDRNQSSISLSTVLDFLRNATRLYVALLTNADRLGWTTPLTDNVTVDLNVTRVLHETVDGLVKSANDEQKADISNLNVTVVELSKSWNSSRQDFASVNDKLIELQNRVNQLVSAMQTDRRLTGESSPATTASSKSTSSDTTTTAATSTVGPSLTTSMVNLHVQTNSSTANVSDVAVPTVTVDTNGTTLPDKVFKPKHTGGTLEDPQQRKPEDTDTDRR